MAKINISINDDLLKKIDDFAKENYTSRSGVVSLATAQYIQAFELQNLLKNVSLAVAKIAESGTVDEETMRMIEDFERATKVIGIN